MKLTQDEILRRFKLKHGDKYDYTNLIYVDIDTIRNVVTNRENYCINFHNIRRVVKVNNKHLTYFGKSYVTIKRL